MCTGALACRCFLPCLPLAFNISFAFSDIIGRRTHLIIMHRSFPTWHEGMKYRTMYVCDRKKCDPCARGCNYTSDINHALYDDHPEHTFVPGEYGYKYEAIRK